MGGKKMSQQIMQLLNEADSDLVWFKEHLEELKKSHDDEFIAIKHRQVVESDKDIERLLRNLKKKKIDSKNVLIQFVSSIPTIF